MTWLVIQSTTKGYGAKHAICATEREAKEKAQQLAREEPETLVYLGCATLAMKATAPTVVEVDVDYAKATTP